MGVRKLNFGLPLVARKTVWVYRVFWAKIETKASKENTYMIKTKFFFLFIYLFIIIIILLLLLFRQSKKNQRENFFIFLFFFYFFMPFLKKQIIIIYSIIYLAGRNWVLTQIIELSCTKRSQNFITNMLADTQIGLVSEI